MIPYWKKAGEAGMRHFRLIVLSLGTQLWISLASFVGSIVLIQRLSSQQYALYTLIASLLGMLGVFCDMGLSVGVNSLGGTAIAEGRRADQILTAAVKMRWVNGLLAGAVLLPLHAWFLSLHGAGVALTLGLLVVAFLTSIMQVKAALVGCYLRLLDRHPVTFVIDSKAAGLRVSLLVLGALKGLTAMLAVELNGVATAASAWMYDKRLGSLATEDAQETEGVRRQLRRLTLQLAPSAAFHCVQGQLYLWLIAIFGATRSVAEVGALSRLAMIVTVFTSGVSVVFAPKFARIPTKRRVVASYWWLSASVAAALLVLWALSWLFPQIFRILLGRGFQGEDADLAAAVAAQCVGGLSAFMYSLSSARGWVRRAWIGIPITIAIQIFGVSTLSIDSTHGVLVFQILSNLPGLVTNVVLVNDGTRGWRRPM